MMKDRLLCPVKRRFVALVAIFAISIVAKADDGVILKLKNGSEVGFVFTSKPKITPSAKLNIATVDGTSVSYDYADVRSVTFGDVTSTGIEDVAASAACDVVFRLFDGKVVVEGLPAGESVSVYDLNGQRVTTHEQGQDNTVISIFLNAHSVHIIRTSNGISCKVVTP
jgi:hypothetical protein